LLNVISQPIEKDNIMNIKQLTLTTAALLFSMNVSANLVVNGSFEDPSLAPSAWSILPSVPGWTLISGDGIEIQNNSVVTAFDGDQYVELDAVSNSIISQTITGFSIGSGYTLSFAYQPRTSDTTVFNDNGIDVDFVWGSGAGSMSIFDIAFQYSDASTDWTVYSYSFNALATTGKLYFGADGVSNGLGGFVDDVVVAAVPEPSVIALFGLGLLGMGAVSRKRKQA
jgi:hypothetical protein